MNDPLASERVLALGRRFLDEAVGLDFPGRVFLAGGAFKTLLHGRPPRDLDLWAPTPDDRARLVSWLRSRGAAPLARHAYAEVFRQGGHELEVPDRAEPPTLEERLGRFDLVMSAIGVELDHGRLRQVVHPQARESAARREVRLLTPLVNWKHALGTLARARRYADELGWVLPAEEEAVVWDLFHAQPGPERDRMIDRFACTAVPGWGVLEEARRRAA